MNHRDKSYVYCLTRGTQAGIVLTEYLIGTIFVTIALFAPMPGLGESAFVYLLESLRAFQANTTYLMSMP